MTRSQLFCMLEPNSVIAEIGTAAGDFAAEILANARPKRLHLIDPWEHQARTDYTADWNNLSPPEFETRYASVCDRFSAPVASGQVVINRAYSPQAADLFDDHYFDSIYIDGIHTADAVLDDLFAFDSKVKPGGLILGHDYTTLADYRALGFGVVEAVNQFVVETGYEFLCLTYEGSPSFVLAKDRNSQARNQLLANIMHNAPMVVEVENAERREMVHKDIFNKDGHPFRTVIGFRGETTLAPAKARALGRIDIQ